MKWILSFGKKTIVNTAHIAKIYHDRTSIFACINNHPPNSNDEVYEEIVLFRSENQEDIEKKFSYFVNSLIPEER